MSASISGSSATFKVAKKVGEPFTSSGTMHLKVGTYETYGVDHDTQPVTANVTKLITLTDNLDNYPADTYPKKFYARYETADGLDWSWVGPITITRTEETATPSGSITSPGSTAQGNFTVSCNAEAPAGLKEVSVYFGNNNLPVVMCKDGTATPCPAAISGAWSQNNINPLEHGISGDGNFTLGLYVKDEDDNYDLVDTQPVTWSKEPPSGTSGSITSPGSTAQGNFKVSCNASDQAGIKKVSVVFVPNGNPLIMCDESTNNPCKGTSGSWSIDDINPLDYGVSGEGQFTAGLWVLNENGDPAALVDSKTVNWSKAPPPANTPPSGSLNTPGSLVVGPLTLKVTAADTDGLQKVSVVFAPNAVPLVLCDDASSQPCTGSSGSWELAGIDPAQYGAAAGSIALALHVQDDASGNTETLSAKTEFTWIQADNQFPVDSKFFNVCVGHNYEQQIPLPDTTMPAVSFANAPTAVKSGEKVLLKTTGTVDTAKGGSAFYYYCTRQGSLLYDDAKPDQVTWIAPFIPGSSQPVKIYAQIGDGLGYIDSEVKTINVSGSLTLMVNAEKALIHTEEILRKSISLDKYLNKLVAFVVKWPGSDIDLLITKPDGTTLDYTGKTVFGYYEGKTQEYYVVYNDQPGTWQIDLKAVDVAEEGEPYEFIGYADAGSQSAEEDADQDGIPDAWEQEHFGDLSHNATTDADNDGLNDLAEYQRGTDPNNTDSDNDGMPDGWEVAHGLDPLANDSGSDADHDGFSNLDEYLAGTDPQDASSTPLNCAATVPGDFSRIQDAVSHVAANAFGGNVCVRHGIYTEAKLTLKDGVYLVAMSNDPAETVLDGNGKDDVVSFQGVRVGGLIGFTLRNSKKNGNAAAVNISGAKQMPLIARNIISGNRHGIRLQGNVIPLLLNNTIADNSGDGITAGGSSPATILNNIVVNNQGDGIVSKGKAIDKLAHNDVYGNKDGNYVGISAGEGGISLDPRFADGYRLAADSPCIGTGLTLDGKVVDMGAYGNSTVALLNKTAAAIFADADQDSIDDNWELLFFGNLSTADSRSDYDRDGYSDVQEYLNNRNRHLDPKGVSFDLTAANAPGGEGYVQSGSGQNLSSSRTEAILRLLLKRRALKPKPKQESPREEEAPPCDAAYYSCP
ncbi:MAG: right-handed parallel beta-helix repeat-containing protein [Candidatus Electronema sp. V4]|uniref:right-handed parallel beta-helix repeat-containing protein n=1 Tax=Candidatus Electronema sp. V4 TaxID=3454756 RepID=UPI004055588F